MRSQIQFFMTSEDEKELLEFAESKIDGIAKESDFQWHLKVGTYSIQLLRSERFDSNFTSGRIAIATPREEENRLEAQSAEIVFGQLRRWIKKQFTNSMTCRNVNIKGSEMAISNFWFSPRIEKLASEDVSIFLTQFRDGPVVFEIKQ